MQSIKNIYEKVRPLILWLGLFELACLGYWLLQPSDNEPVYIVFVIAWVVAMLGWVGLVIAIARKGAYLKYSFAFSNLIGFSIVALFPAALFLCSDVGTNGLIRAANNMSDDQLILFHTMRLLAVGTWIKYLQGELPRHFVLLGTVPDLAFAVSAVILVVAGPNTYLTDEFLIAWHCLGICVFFGAGISMFFSVPSPIRVFTDQPDTRIVFEFPMALAPNFTVPLFVVAHMFALLKVYSG